MSKNVLSFEVKKADLVSFMKRVAVGGAVSSAVIDVLPTGLYFRGCNDAQSIYIDIVQKAEINGDLFEYPMIVNDVTMFNQVIGKATGVTIPIESDSDYVFVKAGGKKIKLGASTPESMKNTVPDSVDFNRKNRVYKCPIGEWTFNRGFALSVAILADLMSDAKQLDIFKFEFNFKKGSADVTIRINNKVDEIENTVPVILPEGGPGFRDDITVVYGNDFKTVIMAIIKDNVDGFITFFIDDETQDTPLLIYDNKCYYFMRNEVNDEDF